MFNDRAKRLLAITGLLALVLIGPASTSVPTVNARAPPEPVCGVCTEALDQAAADHDVSVIRGDTAMVIQLHENGTATFTARVGLADGTDALRNDSLRTAIVRDVSYVVAEDRTHLRTGLSGRTLVVTYRDRVAHRSIGVLRFDAFETRGALPLASGGEGPPYPGADVLVLRAPPGYRVYGSYGNATNGTAVVWYGDSRDRHADRIEDDVVISFLPTDADFPGLRVMLAGVLEWVRSILP